MIASQHRRTALPWTGGCVGDARSRLVAHGPTIDDVTERSRLFRGRDVTASLLSGGHVNRAYVVQVGETRYVVRIPGVSSELLVPDRANERHNTVAAAASASRPGWSSTSMTGRS